jgi:hypothetical protein
MMLNRIRNESDATMVAITFDESSVNPNKLIIKDPRMRFMKMTPDRLLSPITNSVCKANKITGNKRANMPKNNATIATFALINLRNIPIPTKNTIMPNSAAALANPVLKPKLK